MSPPMYQEIVDDIRQRIISGQLAPGAALPSCRELCQSWGVSRQTVGSAMIVLRTQGLIVGAQGRAVYVTADHQKISALRSSAELAKGTALPAAHP
ncbi:hypothetical protein Ais01nite_73510 [Asanoa ishikariensis]|uniref:GntR family transcriptional regulator n=1 Tax=Asanoa ishikariensis TaxID=137265 RepID=A0A1H3USR9_9ACTN|nr:winged helix-turn-helix domain-containing protein [Asanoa ishikariensis]GIF69316.1 hypothetical protein Ais01nite_73510 [Asanoa ishikariensis]SDZ64935.1 GntR family transcriptional regulator [Asanoa ishikariensis]